MSFRHLLPLSLLPPTYKNLPLFSDAEVEPDEPSLRIFWLPSSLEADHRLSNERGRKAEGREEVTMELNIGRT